MNANSITVEISARHVHLSAEHLEVLFGKGAELTHRKDLSQPGQYACYERVDIVGPKGAFNGVSVLGPLRPATQVEISLTDARAMGVYVNIRESGALYGSSGCTLVGPAGTVELQEGCIAAKRHIHMTPKDAEKFGVADKQIVGVKITSGNSRSVIFGDTVVRVNENFSCAMHIDTDESHACGIHSETTGEIVSFE